MAAIVGTPLLFNASLTANFTLTNGSTAGRAVVVLATQYNSFTSLDQVTLDGVLATLPSPVQSDGGTNRALVGVWGDADLPATSGTYEVAIDHAPGTAVVVIELENADVTSVGTIVGAGAATVPSPFDFAGNAGAFLGLAWTQVTGSDPTSTTGDTEYYGDNRVLIAGRIDSGSGGDISLSGTAGSSFTYAALSVDSASSGPSITITDPIVPGSTTTFSTSGNEDPWTGVRITDSGGNVKELTLESQTSLSAPAVGTLDYALFGDVTVEVYNATESAEDTIAFDPPAGFSNLALEAGFVTTQESFLFEYGGTPAVPDQFTYDPIASDTGETLTLGSDGLWTATGYGTWTVYGSDATDGEMQSFQFVWEAVAGAVGKLTRRNLTRRTLTRRSLTARP